MKSGNWKEEFVPYASLRGRSAAGVVARAMRPNPQPLPKWEGESAPSPFGEGWGGVV